MIEQIISASIVSVVLVGALIFLIYKHFKDKRYHRATRAYKFQKILKKRQKEFKKSI